MKMHQRQQMVGQRTRSDSNATVNLLLNVYEDLGLSSTPIPAVAAGDVMRDIFSENSGKQSSLLEVRDNGNTEKPPEEVVAWEDVQVSERPASERGIRSDKDDEFVWTENMHLRVLQSIFDFAIAKISPKKIVVAMEGDYPKSMTTEHMKSHLQKFRNKCTATQTKAVSAIADAIKEEYATAARRLSVDDSSKMESLLQRYPIGLNLLDEYDKPKPKARGRKRRRPKTVPTQKDDVESSNVSLSNARVHERAREDSASTAFPVRNSEEGSNAADEQVYKYSYQSALEDLTPTSSHNATRQRAHSSDIHESADALPSSLEPSARF